MKTLWSAGGTILVRVGPHHFAFLRGYFEGLPLAILSKRYLETAVAPDPDLRIAKSTLRWIREQLMIAARRRGLFAEARLILLDPDKLRGPEKRAVPTLEEFREIRDPHEMFSEAELIELFHEEYGSNAHSDRRTTRNERLRRRQVTALLELEKLLVSAPSPADDVAGWLHPVLAKRLRNAGLLTLGELVQTINARGYRWWTKVPRFGEKAAAQVVAWLRTESTTKGLGISPGVQAVTKERKIPAGALAKERSPYFGVAPLEYLQLPDTLNGSSANNRARACSIHAADDLEAVKQWLATKQEGSSTWRSYRKEAERLLLWATLERGKSISSLSPEDCRDYTYFLETLGAGDPSHWHFKLPREHWIAPRGTKRWSTLWRPFEGGLSASSRQLAVTILSLMGHWLVSVGYWATNPWDATPAQMPGQPFSRTPKGFSPSQWAMLWQRLDGQKSDEQTTRLRFILALCQETKMRPSEVVAIHRSDLQPQDLHSLDAGGAVKIVTGPRRGIEVPISNKVLRELDAYLLCRGLGGIAGCPATALLVGRLATAGTHPRDLGSISTNGLYLILKEFFVSTAEFIRCAPPTDTSATGDSDAEVFLKATADWLRY